MPQAWEGKKTDIFTGTNTFFGNYQYFPWLDRNKQLPRLPLISPQYSVEKLWITFKKGRLIWKYLSSFSELPIFRSLKIWCKIKMLLKKSILDDPFIGCNTRGYVDSSTFCAQVGGISCHRRLLRVLFPEDSDTETILGLGYEKDGALLGTSKRRSPNQTSIGTRVHDPIKLLGFGEAGNTL